MACTLAGGNNRDPIGKYAFIIVYVFIRIGGAEPQRQRQGHDRGVCQNKSWPIWRVVKEDILQYPLVQGPIIRGALETAEEREAHNVGTDSLHTLELQGKFQEQHQIVNV